MNKLYNAIGLQFNKFSSKFLPDWIMKNEYECITYEQM